MVIISLIVLAHAVCTRLSFEPRTEPGFEATSRLAPATQASTLAPTTSRLNESRTFSACCIDTLDRDTMWRHVVFIGELTEFRIIMCCFCVWYVISLLRAELVLAVPALVLRAAMI